MIWRLGGNLSGKYHLYEEPFEFGSIASCGYQFRWKTYSDSPATDLTDLCSVCRRHYLTEYNEEPMEKC